MIIITFLIVILSDLKKFTIERIIIAFVAAFYILSGFYAKSFWQQNRQGGDGLGYYIYLPSIFIYDDLGDFTKTSLALKKYVPDMQDLSIDKYGFRPTKTGKLADKYPVGLAILQSPFFAIAHAYALTNDGYEADGFSRPYQVICFFSTMFYVLIGLWLLQKVLIQYFGRSVSALTILLMAIGTNLLFFTSFFSAMSHAYQFWAVCMLIFFTNKLYQEVSTRNAILVGVSLGLVGIIRSQDLIFGLIPILWSVYSKDSLLQRLALIKSNFTVLSLSIAAFLMTIAPQLIYYKYISGQWLYFSYAGESFNWLKPQIVNGLFAPENGWFLYTPIMLVAIAGIFIRSTSTKYWRMPMILILCLHIYISYSWWCWYYIAGMGSRPMVDIYPLLAFPLANIIAWSFTKASYISALVISLSVFLGLQNLRFTYQQYHGYIFSEFNNEAYYKAMFFKIKPDKEAILAFNTGDVQPKEHDLMPGDTLFYSDFENKPENADTIIKKNGTASLNMTNENVNLSTFNIKPNEIHNGDWIKVSMSVFLQTPGVMYTHLGKFILEFKENENSTTIWKDAKPTALIGNNNHSIWHAGESGKWEEVTYYIQVPFEPNDRSTLRLIGFNPSKIVWNIDDLLIQKCVIK